MVAAVGPYFQKFVKRWPTVHHLARASLDDVLRMWAGLGYYRRARSLHQCARIICAEYDGQFPPDEKTLIKLPGFGAYTAAAVAAIAFDQRANVVDGNVERVVARIFALRAPLPKAKKALRDAAAKLLPADRFGDYAQALMDLGATICTPRNPKCALCPWNDRCRANKLGIAARLPRKTKPANKPVRCAIAFALFNRKGELFLRQRPPEGLLGGMMEIPSSAWEERKPPKLADVIKYAPVPTNWRLLPEPVTHVFSHFKLNIQIAVGTTTHAAKGWWVNPDKLDNEALPSVMLKIAHRAVEGL